ncbi:cortex morphogenetic protein CmpA [Kroppenstedtia pulmonis]|uniref:Cortex morphogenetic protein CmpA n=1 Tax=Kroppenstedtia pulmonis TaxID=1380685 RepID=A0A7D4CPN2_9BACL|nr:cortex morphogenetic protein CmpA [Kroppenstedtia pulmonis]QKG85438.1 cortex morphogenetic protein CmpA [Kroppenstedtia pulmonis]
MPYWLTKQLKRAFQGKDRRQIRILNDCWFQYQHNQNSETIQSHSDTK